jgi:shikimate kinase
MKTIYILIGLKGSGKTYIGTLLQNKRNIPFLRVEDICLKIKADRKIDDQDYISEAFEKIETEIRKKLLSVNQLTIESTASAIQFDQMVFNLRKDFVVKLIKIETDPKLCMQRVRTRDQENHISVSDEEVTQINTISAQRKFDFDLTIQNNFKSDNELLDELSRLG